MAAPDWKGIRPMLIEFAAKNMAETADEVRRSGGGEVAELLLKTFEALKAKAASFPASEVVERCWDKLTKGGGWPNVGWREAYVFALMVVAAGRSEAPASEADAMSVENARTSMKDLDMALIMGGSNANEIVHALIALIEPTLLLETKAETQQDEGSWIFPDSVPIAAPRIDDTVAVERVASISFAGFKKKYFKTDTAVIITGALEEWPASTRWKDMRYLVRNFGHRTVPVELGQLENGRKKEGWREEALLLGDLIRNHIVPSNQRMMKAAAGDSETQNTSDYKGGEDDGEVAYLAQHLLFDQIPGLAADIQVPDLCDCGDFSGANAWLGTARTVTPLHHDAQDNFLAQVVGFKYIRIYDHLQTPLLYVTKPGQGDGISAQGNVSPVNPEALDQAAHPLAASAVYKEALLGPGDMLYIPSRHWHYVRSLSPSFSVNFWF